MSRSKIEIRGLCKAFDGNVVLDGLDLDLEAGESLVVIGRSGSGKSVLLKCILGLLQPEAGSIKVDGEEVVGLGGDALERIRRRFGMLFQSAALFDSLSVLDNVAFGLTEGAGLPARKARAIALERLADVGLSEEIAALYPAELSGGMRKRVGLARAIAIEPAIVFFDEPTTGLDPIVGAMIDALIVETVRGLGIAGLSITHDMASARRIADRIALLYQGRIVWAGPAGEIDRCDDPYLRQFIRGEVRGPIDVGVDPDLLEGAA